MNNISDDRIKELREWLSRCGGVEDFPEASEILAILSDYSSQRAELAALRHIMDCAYTPLVADVLRERDELKAQLERQRPLVEAAINVAETTREVWGDTLIKAALKLRSEK